MEPPRGRHLALVLPDGGLELVPAPDGVAQDLLGLRAVRPAVRARTAPGTATILGRLGGAPDWLQDDETPSCPACAQPVDCTVELIEGRDPVTAMNFGSGAAAQVQVCV
ncbi:hypothetical protein ACFXGI_02595 [Streptomyces sp. NPDC059355]|uniref:hypothetical protein n=1 Tax=Streptomyces sp. NPDC059355 TaxID=3346811 RepID=UPI0036CBB28E